MINYDNARQFAILCKLSGSVLPRSVFVGFICCFMGSTLAALRHFKKTGDRESVPGEIVHVEHQVAIETVAVVVGYLLVVRTNMALQRWMGGLSEIQLMLSKWADAFDALNGFFAGKQGTPEEMERITNFKIRIAHWFSLMSCLAFATLRNGGHLDSLDDVPIKEMFAEKSLKKTKSFASNGTASSRPSGNPLEALDEKPKEQQFIDGLDLYVLSAPTSEEVALLEMAQDKVSAVCFWIMQGVVLEIRAGTLDTPAPIVSRIFQEISNGMLGFNQAHKVAMVPFPFPFAQMVSLLLVILYVFLPLYLDTFTQTWWVTPIVSFLLPVCYGGLNWIAIELEEPFGTDHNDVDIEVRHEEFLWMLVDVLRQPASSPSTPDSGIERKILRGIARNQPFAAREVQEFARRTRLRALFEEDDSTPSNSMGDTGGTR